ncbi:hypothetical protein [Pedobacter sp. GR22-10]|nr:hypothetical protein [Pedobacter sp. GR22-10]MCX2429560.1 hypothetical protein [Pedobacter sp. GR22-10]
MVPGWFAFRQSSGSNGINGRACKGDWRVYAGISTCVPENNT